MLDRTSTRLGAAVLAAALAAAPLAALAQPSSAANTSATRRDAFVERRISQLRDEIKITPNEETSFNDFAAAMRHDAANMDAAVEKGATLPASASAVQRMQSYADMSQVHAQNMQQLTAAFTTFYNSLTPQQQKVVDASFAKQAARRASNARNKGKA